MSEFTIEPIIHQPKILSYAIDLKSIGLPDYTDQERNKCINNIVQIICKSGLAILSESTITQYLYGFISLQQITGPEWELLQRGLF